MTDCRHASAPLSLVLPGDTEPASRTRPLTRDDAAAVTALMAGVRAAGRRRGAHRGGRHRRRLAAPGLRPRHAVGRRRSTATASSPTPRSTRAAGPTPRSTRPTADAASGPPCRTGPGPSPARDGGTLVGQPVPGDSPASGCWPPSATGRCGPRGCCEMPAGAAIDPQPVPEGYAVREPRDEADLRATWTVNEDAFLEWSERERDDLRGVGGERRHGGPATSRGSCASWSTRDDAGRRHGLRRRLERLRLRRQARGARATSAARGWPGRCSWTPSRWPGHTVGSGPSCRPTPAPARSVSMRRSACRSRRCGATGRRT